MSKEVILVVEDNFMNYELVKALLEAGGYQVIHSESAFDAVEALKTVLPDLILTDIQLPDLDGYGLIKILRKDERLSSVPIVALTAYAMKGDEEKMIELGCKGYISKPINTREFLKTIESYII